jgi:hypothetical protein
MMENFIVPPKMNDTQRRVFIDAVQLFQTYTQVFRESRSYRGGMHWKKAKGKQYLFRSKDRLGYGKSLGPRSEQTEKILERFKQAKHENSQRLSAIRDRLKEQARFCRAASIQRVPNIVAGILRVLDQQKLLGKSISIIGTNAIYAYEAAAGVFVDSPVLATQDVDMLWDVRARLNLAIMDQNRAPGGMIDLLKKCDRSFRRVGRQPFRAVNKDGYMVDLVKPQPRSVVANERSRLGDASDLEAAEIGNLQWLVSSPKFFQVVIGNNGYPAPMVCPDPRAFAVHKIWMSRQPDRDPLKKQRDRDQALTVAWIVSRYLPQYEFSSSELKMFPKAIVDHARQDINALDVPDDFK